VPNEPNDPQKEPVEIPQWLMVIVVIAAIIGLFAILGPPEPGPGPGPGPDPEGPLTVVLVKSLGAPMTKSQVDELAKLRLEMDNWRKQDDKAVEFFQCNPDSIGEDGTRHAGAASCAAAVPSDQKLPYVLVVAKTGEGKWQLEPDMHGPFTTAKQVMDWVKAPELPQPARGPPQAAAVDETLDVNFFEERPELCGMLEPGPMRMQLQASYPNVRDIPGFRPIPQSEWDDWCETFPPSRMVQYIRHTSEQVMGSCVGHSGRNGTEGPMLWLYGEHRWFQLSAMSMYRRIGSGPNSGAYIGDCADELDTRGILPDSIAPNTELFEHTHQDTGGWSNRLPSGWESTGKKWRCQVYRVTDKEAWFTVTMGYQLRIHLGRSRHAISGVFVVKKNGRYYYCYENSWGADWGDYNKSIGYDSTAYDGYVYWPCIPNHIPFPSLN